MAAVAVTLRARLDELEWSISQLAVQANVDRTTVHDLLAGRAYCDVVTLAKLERAVDAQLWPGPQS
jgi:ribosome-binding protein aMBF1 (putative translation factor)